MDNGDNNNTASNLSDENKDFAAIKPNQSSEEELDTEIEQFRGDVAGEVEEEGPEVQDVKPKGPEYYLTDFLVEAYRNASPYLKQNLRGQVELAVSGEIQKTFNYTFADDAIYAQGQKNAESIVSADYRVIDNIIRGRVNAQVALLSNQIKVSGNIMKGMYFLNLFRAQRP